MAIACLYLYGLSRVGVLDPDEPRYLAIGHAMVQTGDFITPRLWGDPWFEKAPLLYWMTSLGVFAHLNTELSGRLPVGLLSLGFLATMFELLRREFGSEAAGVSTALLATSAGWLAYSSFALTDLPMSVFFSLAVFLALPLLRTTQPSVGKQALRFLLLGACLGLAELAKGLVPLALAVPFVWFLRRWWRSWPYALFAILAIALPWNVAVYLQNGNIFIKEFYWKQHFERLYSASLQHVQPWYYYFPVLLASLFPWTTLLPLLFVRNRAWDERKLFLASCFVFGFVLFSVSLNKLPGYLLPLLPCVLALLGASVDWSRFRESQRLWLLPCAMLIALLPIVARALPEILAMGRFTVPHHFSIGRIALFYSAAPLLAVWFTKRSWTGTVLVLCLVAGGLFLKSRGVWQHIRYTKGTICDDWLDRDWKFGLALYAGKRYPLCDSGTFDFALRSRGKAIPTLHPLHPLEPGK